MLWHPNSRRIALRAAICLVVTCGFGFGANVPSPAVQLVLHFFDPDGKPAANREIGYRIHHPRQNPFGGLAATDSLGMATVLVSFGRDPAPEKTELVSFVPGEFCSDPVVLEFEAGKRRITKRVRLKAGGGVSGVIRDDATSVALGGVILRLMRVAPDDFRKRLWNEHAFRLERMSMVPGAMLPLRRWKLIGTEDVSYSASSDGTGEFQFHHIPEGEYEMIPFPDGNFDFRKRLKIRDGQTIEDLEIRVPRFPNARGILGNVYSETESAPMVLTEVMFDVAKIENMIARTVYPRRVATEIRGGFYLHPVPPGDYLVTAFAPGYGGSKSQRVSLSEHSAKHLKFILHHSPPLPEN